MSTLLTRPKADSGSGVTAASEGAGHNGGQPGDGMPQRTCPKCGSPMQPLQDWCLQCGAGAPGSLGSGLDWRGPAAILGATALLVAGASVAAYAAMSKTTGKPTLTVAASRPLTTTTPITTTPGAATTPGATTPGATTTPSATSNPGTPTTIKATPPKIPLQTPTPRSGESGANEEANNALFGGEKGKSSTKSSSTSTSTKSSTTESSGSSKTTSGSSKAESGAEGKESESGSASEPPSPILLDTNAASTYNPYAYPASLFGEPSLTIDGEEKTAWTAQVQASVAPKMAEGVVLDMKTAQKVGTVVVKTTTPGLTVEMYGANGHTLPASITDTAWRRLSGSKTLGKKSTTLKLKTGGTAYRFILLWITKAPSGSTASKPGSVSINELELFPPS